MRLYDAIVNGLPYVVVVVGALSVLLGVTALTAPDVDAGFTAWTALLFGVFLLWSGVSVLREKREARRRDDEGR